MPTPRSSSNPAFRNVGQVVQGQQDGRPHRSGAVRHVQPAVLRAADPVDRPRYLTLDDVIAKTATVLVAAVLAAVGTI